MSDMFVRVLLFLVSCFCSVFVLVYVFLAGTLGSFGTIVFVIVFLCFCLVFYVVFHVCGLLFLIVVLFSFLCFVSRFYVNVLQIFVSVLVLLMCWDLSVGSVAVLYVPIINLVS